MKVTIEAEQAIRRLLNEHGIQPVLTEVARRITIESGRMETALPLNTDEVWGKVFNVQSNRAIAEGLQRLVDEHGSD